METNGFLEQKNIHKQYSFHLKTVNKNVKYKLYMDNFGRRRKYATLLCWFEDLLGQT